MSTLTKTFVILNLIFSVAFVMVSATVLSQRHHWREKHAALSEEHKRTLDTLNGEVKELNRINGDLRTDRDKFKTLAERRQDQLSDRDTDIKERDDAIADFKTKEQKANTRVESLSQNVNRLASDLADTQKSLNLAKDELQKAKTDLGVRNTTLVGLRARLAAMEQQYKELRYRQNIVVAERNNLREWMDEVKVKYPEIGDRRGAGGTERIVKAPAIRSVVRAVDAKMGIVVLGVGSESKPAVKKGYRFLIHRGSTFVGAVRVVNVDAEMCAARLVDPPTGAAIQVGDKAITQ